MQRRRSRCRRRMMQESSACAPRCRQWLLKPQIYSCVCAIMMLQTRGHTPSRSHTLTCIQTHIARTHKHTHTRRQTLSRGVHTKSRVEQYDVCQIHTTHSLAAAHTHPDTHTNTNGDRVWVTMATVKPKGSLLKPS